MTDSEFQELRAKEEMLWALIKTRKEQLEPIEHEWCDIHRALQREQLRREIMAEVKP